MKEDEEKFISPKYPSITWNNKKKWGTLPKENIAEVGLEFGGLEGWLTAYVQVVVRAGSDTPNIQYEIYWFR